MRFLVLMLMLMSFPTSVFAGAEDDIAKRSISLSWEEIPDSTSYDLELTRVLPDGTKKKSLVFKTKANEWTGKIHPGTYEMRLRAIDDRGVPGDWSDPSKIPVKLPSIAMELAKPAAKEELKTNEAVETEIPFSWPAIPGAKKYRVDVFADDRDDAKGAEPLASTVFDGTSGVMKLPVAKKYKWRVSGISSEDVAGDDPPEAQSITVIGKKISLPEILKPDTKFVTGVAWKAPEHAEKYDYVLSRRAKNSAKWEVVDKKTQTDATEITLDPKKPGGIYKLQVKAYGSLRESSATKTVEFPVYEGLRTPAAIETAMLREAMEKDFDRYFIATYLISNLGYYGTNHEFNMNAYYSALAGTGRIGYGYMPKGKWGMLTTLDMSGVIINGTNHTFGSFEIQAIWRRYISQATQWRISGGWLARQIPEARGQNPANVDVSNIGQMGPTVGTQLWHSLTYKLGIQLNAQANWAAVKMSTPSGGDIIPTLSSQIGMLFSYRLKESITGFAGIARRSDVAKYKAQPWDGNPENKNQASAGDINSVTMIGDYLNLYLEWGF